MPRAKGGPKTRQRRKKVLKKAKGYVGGRRKLVIRNAPGILKDQAKPAVKGARSRSKPPR